MRATLNIPDELIEEVQKITGARTKTEAIVVSLKEIIRKKRIADLISMRGKVDIDYDWEKEEDRELKAQRKREALLEKIK